jgi:hypothetical protein
MKQNLAADPLDVSIHRSDGIMKDPQALPNLVQKFRFGALGRHVIGRLRHRTRMSLTIANVGPNIRNSYLANSFFSCYILENVKMIIRLDRHALCRIEWASNSC